MHIRPKYCFTALALLALAVPAFAHTDTAELTVIQPTTIGSAQLKAGDYKMEVKDNQARVTVINTETGKTVAQVPCHWIQLQKKPNTTQVVTNNNQVIEIDFGGKTQAVKVGQG